MPITQTVTWQDLIEHYEGELSDLRDAWDELVADAEDEYGEDRSAWPEDVQQQATLINETAKVIQQRQHAIEEYAEAYPGEWELSMLTGRQLTALETDLRVEADNLGIDVDELQTKRKQLAVDESVVSGPDGVPTEDGDPVPSELPNPITLALYEQVETLNHSGSTDFRAQGFADEDTTALTGSSDTPTNASEALSDMDLDE